MSDYSQIGYLALSTGDLYFRDVHHVDLSRGKCKIHLVDGRVRKIKAKHQPEDYNLLRQVVAKESNKIVTKLGL